MHRALGCALLAVLAVPPAAWAAPAVRHDITVTLEPRAHQIRVTDRLTVPPAWVAADGTVRFTLHRGLAIGVADAAVLLPEARDDPRRVAVPTTHYRAVLLPGRTTLTLTYEGTIHHPPTGPGGDTPGLIDGEGALLSGASHWYPQVLDPAGGDALVTFSLTVDTPAAWDAVSQGSRAAKAVEEGRTRTTWREANPQDEIHLVAGPFTEYVQVGGPAPGLVFLRAPDRELADRYLTATARYLTLYERLIGPYPYGKFALVENRWETGFGMPSFTLMGPTILRFPFIVDTSYPHEILHNWWGNGVFVDLSGGNWSEGLTAYLADHLVQERRGRGATYRREALQRYADFVRAGRDFPLTDFVARRGQVTQAVGYGKSMMLFHMIRRRMGDDAFLDALMAFYREHRFTRAGWDDLEAAFSRAAGADLQPVLDPWLTRTGAPALAVTDARATRRGEAFGLTATLRQIQPAAPYPLRVPLAVTLEGHPEAIWRTVSMTGREEAINLSLPARPLRLDVDPAFDLFRQLAPGETPPALSGLLGAERVLFVLPAAAPEALMEAYRGLAEARGKGAESRVVLDTQLDALPADGTAVWLLGRDNRFVRAAAAALADAGDVLVTDAGVILPEGPVPVAEHTLVFAARDPRRGGAPLGHGGAPLGRGGAPLGWIATDNAKALPGLARKLPHYAKYGYLAFEGDAPDNVLKGQWEPRGSALSVPVVPPDGRVVEVPPAPLAPRPALAPP